MMGDLCKLVAFPLFIVVIVMLCLCWRLSWWSCWGYSVTIE